jgi:hypothetical protein
MSALAPIAVFAYRRMDKLAQALDRLELCPEFAQSPVFVFSDAGKNDAGAADVAAVRQFLRSRLRVNMTIVEAPLNLGCAASIVNGVTRLCTQYGRVIVIEDDLVVSPFILTWFNAALDRYESNLEVMQISGHVFGSRELSQRKEGFFLPMTTSWGWATWQRAWANFLPDADGWERLASDAALRRRFDLGGAYPYSRMLERQRRGEVDSWAIRWYWTVFRLGGLGLFPPKTLVLNEGDDTFATHGGLLKTLRRIIGAQDRLAVEPPKLPNAVELNREAFRKVRSSVIRRRF